MNFDNHIARYNGQSLLYNTKDPSLRGQCVQQICFYMADNGKPVAWADASSWWKHPALTGSFDFIPNGPNNLPPRGAIVIWGSDLPNSGNKGHIAIFDAKTVPGQFRSFDSNWGGKTCHFVTHNWDYVIGWMVPKAPPAPAPQPQQGGGIEMIRGRDNAVKAYQTLRPSGAITEAEINATADKRSYEEFINTGMPEVQARNNAIRQQDAERANMQNIINTQNSVITELTQKIQSSETSVAEKQKALQDGLTKIAECTTQLETSHDKQKEYQNIISGLSKKLEAETNKSNFIARLFTIGFGIFKGRKKQ